MNQILLQPDGIILCDAKAADGSPLFFLNHSVQLAPLFTLRSYFLLLETYPLLQDLNAFFPMLMDEYRKSPEKGCISDGFDHLEFNKAVEMIGFPGKPRIEIYTAFRGVYKGEGVELRSFRIEGLLDMPVKLGRLKHIVFGDKMELFEFDTIYTLFEFIDGIAWELSFHGTPPECQIRR